MTNDRHSIALFTDVDGDVGSADLVKRHREVAIDVLDRIGGVAAHATGAGIAATGAGVSATFTDANRALICAVQIQRSFEEWGSSKTAPVRIGIAHDDEAAVTVAAHAGDGEILVTETVRALAEPRGHLFTARGDLQIAGAPAPIFAVRWWEHD